LEQERNVPTADSHPVIVVTGGGTGGHLYPALAVAEMVQQQGDVQLHFIGLQKERDQKEVQTRGIPFHGIRLEGLRRRFTFTNIRAVLLALVGLIRCLWILKSLGKGVVFGVGGYVAAPAMMAGRILGWTLALHEQNAVPGRVNRFLARWCHCIFLTFEDSKNYFAGMDCRITGMPVRTQLAAPATEKKSRVRDQNPMILVIGGSQGARKLVEICMASFLQVQKTGLEFRAIIQTGEGNFEWAKTLPGAAGITLTPFIENMAAIYSQTDLIISRAGAGSLAEIALWGLPSLLVPYPYAADDHQRINAEQFEKAGASHVILENDLVPERITAMVRDLLEHPDKREDMGKHAAALAVKNASSLIAESLMQLLKVK
jgi:UDP-N-acetylglucosamine--N-acetylmuramyl-(pentapeptide) pyrophosphoryl-undecaprenol N-acetylglucosamine transferase